MKMRPVNSNCYSHAYQSLVCVCSLQETGEVYCEQSLISLSSKIIFIATSTFTSHQLSWFYVHNNIIRYCTTPASASPHRHSQIWYMDKQEANDSYKHPQMLNWCFSLVFWSHFQIGLPVWNMVKPRCTRWVTLQEIENFRYYVSCQLVITLQILKLARMCYGAYTEIWLNFPIKCCGTLYYGACTFIFVPRILRRSHEFLMPKLYMHTLLKSSPLLKN